MKNIEIIGRKITTDRRELYIIYKIDTGIINNDKLVELFGSPKNKITYANIHKVAGSMKKPILETAKQYCDIYDLGKGKYEIKKVYNNFIFPNIKKMKMPIYKYIIPLLLIKLMSIYNRDTKLNNPLISWATLIKMITPNYKAIRKHKIKVGNKYDFDIDITTEFFDNVDSQIKKYIEKSLQLLSDVDILQFEKVKMIYKCKLDSNNKVKTKINILSQSEIASTEELLLRQKIIEKVKMDLDIVNEKECFFGRKALSYKKELSEHYKKFNISFFYDSFRIYDIDLEKCNSLLLNFKYTDQNALITDLNNALIKKVLENALNRYNKAVEENSDKLYRRSENYIKQYEKLSEWTINNKCDFNIYNEIDFSDEVDNNFVDMIDAYEFIAPSGEIYKLSKQNNKII